MCKKRSEAVDIIENGMRHVERQGKPSENSYQIRPYSTCEVWSVIGEKTYRGVGQSIQGPHDAWDANRGYQIAYGRAIMDIAKRAGLI